MLLWTGSETVEVEAWAPPTWLPTWRTPQEFACAMIDHIVVVFDRVSGRPVAWGDQARHRACNDPVSRATAVAQFGMLDDSERR